jgi:hypothetical protein
MCSVRLYRTLAVLGRRDGAKRVPYRSYHACGTRACNHWGAMSAKLCKAWRIVSPTHSKRLRCRAAACMCVESVRCLPRACNTPRLGSVRAGHPTSVVRVLRPGAGRGMHLGSRKQSQSPRGLALADISSRCGGAPRPPPVGPRDFQHTARRRRARGALGMRPAARVKDMALSPQTMVVKIVPILPGFPERGNSPTVSLAVELPTCIVAASNLGKRKGWVQWQE